MSSEPGRRPATERDNRPMIELDRLVALAPPDLADLDAAVRELCPATVGLPPLPAAAPPEPSSARVRTNATSR